MIRMRGLEKYYETRAGRSWVLRQIDFDVALHRGGATICMVTHDPRYELYADRTVRLFDGRVVDESEALEAES